MKNLLDSLYLKAFPEPMSGETNLLKEINMKKFLSLNLFYILEFGPKVTKALIQPTTRGSKPTNIKTIQNWKPDGMANYHFFKIKRYCKINSDNVYFFPLSQVPL